MGNLYKTKNFFEQVYNLFRRNQKTLDKVIQDRYIGGRTDRMTRAATRTAPKQLAKRTSDLLDQLTAKQLEIRKPLIDKRDALTAELSNIRAKALKILPQSNDTLNEKIFDILATGRRLDFDYLRSLGVDPRAIGYNAKVIFKPEAAQKALTSLAHKFNSIQEQLGTLTDSAITKRVNDATSELASKYADMQQQLSDALDAAVDLPARVPVKTLGREFSKNTRKLITNIGKWTGLGGTALGLGLSKLLGSKNE